MKISTLNLSILCSLIIGVFTAHGQKNPSTIGLKDGVSESWTPEVHYRYSKPQNGGNWELSYKAVTIYDGYNLMQETRMDSATGSLIGRTDYFYDGIVKTTITSTHDGMDFIPEAMEIAARIPYHDEFSRLYKRFTWNGAEWDTLTYDSAFVITDGNVFMGHETYRYDNGGMRLVEYSEVEREGDTGVWNWYDWTGTSFELDLTYAVVYENNIPISFIWEEGNTFVKIDSLDFVDPSVLGINRMRFSNSENGIDFTPTSVSETSLPSPGVRKSHYYDFVNGEWSLVSTNYNYSSPFTQIDLGYHSISYANGSISSEEMDTTYITYDQDGKIVEEIRAFIEDGEEWLSTKKVYNEHANGISNYMMEQEKIEVFPNPAQDYIKVSSLNGKPLIFGIDGKVHAVSVSGDGKIDVSKLPSGKYWVTDSKNSGRGVFMKR